MKSYNNREDLVGNSGNARPVEVSKTEPCIHCGKPDWCYSLGALTVCKREADPAPGWEKTKKTDKEGTSYYAPAHPKKPPKSAGKQEFFYSDRDGNPFVRVTRIDGGGGERRFYQSHWDSEKWVNGLPENIAQIPIYRYQQVREAIAAGEAIFLVEGEGCADKLWGLGIAATTTLGGSGKYRSYGDYRQDLADAQLILCPDRDEPGLKHMETVAYDFPRAKWLYAPPNEFFWQHLPKSQGLDIANWIDDGASAENIYGAVRDKWQALAESLGNPATSASELSPKEKSIGELEAEIIAAATSKNYKLALTKVAATNNLPFDVVEYLAKSLIKDEGLEPQHDIAKLEYERCMHEIREIELKEDPGEKDWKLQDTARKYRRSVREMLEAYYKSILIQHLEDPISLQEFRQNNPEGRKWLLRGWLPEKSLILFHAHGGLGKTLFVHHLIKHVAQGIDWGEYKVKSGRNGILYLQTDTSLSSAVEAIRQAGIPDDVPLQIHGKWRIEFMAYLYRWVKQQRPALVVIDSLTSANRYSTVSENDTSYAQPVLQLRDIAAEFGCTFIIIHHSNGAGEVRGTKAVRAAVDEVWRMERTNKADEGDPKRLLVIEKSRSRATKRYEVQFDDDDFSWDLLEPEAGEGEPAQNSSTGWLIVNHLNKDPGTRHCAEDLAHSIGIPESTVRRELPGLAREGLIDRELNPKYNSHTKGEPKHFYLINL